MALSTKFISYKSANSVYFADHFGLFMSYNCLLAGSNYLTTGCERKCSVLGAERLDKT